MFDLRKTLGALFKANQPDEAWFLALEEALLQSDVGLPTTEALMVALRRAAKLQKTASTAELQALLIQLVAELLKTLEPNSNPLLTSSSIAHPEVWLIVGVNGAGKTTTIGKLCHHFQNQGKSILLAAGDTFRAAARQQLQEWGLRNSRQSDVLLIDTAGRLSTQDHLMAELKKIKRVIGKILPGAPHHTLLILDGNTGQNGLSQVKAFHAALGLSDLIITKLDGTAKGGVICALAHLLQGPEKPRLLGLGKGESLGDLVVFNAAHYAAELFN